METPVKHFKFINSKTDNVIYYYSIDDGNIDPIQIKNKLEAIKAEVAVNNGVFLETVYWEEVKEE